MFGDSQRIIDSLRIIHQDLNVVKSDVEVIKSNVVILDRRGTSAGVERAQKLADTLDGCLLKIENHETRIKSSEKRADRANKGVAAAGITGLGGLLSYFQFFSK